MRRIPNTWPSTAKTNNTLFIAQVLDEMATQYSPETYRAYALSTLGRLNEAISVSNLIEGNRMSSESLNPILEEVEWSIKTDPIARKAIENVDDVAKIVKNQIVSNKVRSNQIKYIRSIVTKSYKRQIEKSLLDHVRNKTNKKHEIKKLCGLYISFISNHGYSRAFIRTSIRDQFFSGDVSRTGPSLLSGWFKNFEMKTYDYTCFVSVSKGLFDICKSIGVKTYTKFADLIKEHRIFSDHRAELRKNILQLPYQDAADVFSARTIFMHIINSFSSFSNILPRQSTCELESDLYLLRKRTRTIRQFNAREQKFIMLHHTWQSNSETLNRINKFMIASAGRESTGTLLRSTLLLESARGINDPDMRLTTAWSALESLVPLGLESGSRINHYVSLLAPAITFRYPYRSLNYVFFDLRRIFKKNFDSNFSSGKANLKEFAEIIMDPTLSTQRQALCHVCREHPLALYRLWWLERVMSSGASLKKFIDNYQKMITWQLHRIYRFRNLVMHQGMKRKDSYLYAQYLVEYYRTIMDNLSYVEEQNNGVGDIDEALGYISVECRILDSFLQKKGGRGSENDDLVRQVLKP